MNQVKKTRALDAAELILSGENPWRDCGCCSGHGQIPKIGNKLRDSMGNVTSLALVSYKKCPACSGQGRMLKVKFNGIHKALGLPPPVHPGVKPVDAPGPKYTLVSTSAPDPRYTFLRMDESE